MSFLHWTILAICILGVLHPAHGQKKNRKASKGAQDEPEDPTAQEILAASFNGDLEALERLVQSGVDVNIEDSSGFRPLHGAAQGGQEQAVSFLVGEGSDVNAQSADGTTALYLAVQAQSIDAAKALLGAGADTEMAVEGSGSAPLMVACVAGFTDGVALLLKNKALVTARDKLGRTALHWAATQSGHKKILKLLKKAGADTNAQDARGETPLIFASFFGHIDTVKALLKAGADPSIRNNEQESPVDIICKCKEKSCTFEDACDTPTEAELVKVLNQ